MGSQVTEFSLPGVSWLYLEHSSYSELIYLQILHHCMMQNDYSLHLLIREIPDHYAIYGSASCHCDHTVHIAELVMSQKMAAFVLASMGKVCWRVFHCLFADTA